MAPEGARARRRAPTGKRPLSPALRATRIRATTACCPGKSRKPRSVAPRTALASGVTERTESAPGMLHLGRQLPRDRGLRRRPGPVDRRARGARRQGAWGSRGAAGAPADRHGEVAPASGGRAGRGSCCSHCKGVRTRAPGQLWALTPNKLQVGDGLHRAARPAQGPGLARWGRRPPAPAPPSPPRARARPEGSAASCSGTTSTRLSQSTRRPCKACGSPTQCREKSSAATHRWGVPRRLSTMPGVTAVWDDGAATAGPAGSGARGAQGPQQHRQDGQHGPAPPSLHSHHLQRAVAQSSPA